MAGKKATGAERQRVALSFYDGHGYSLPANHVVGWQFVWCAGYETDEAGKKRFHHIEGTPCTCPAGPQALAITSEENEVAFLGGRGSMKTETSFAFLGKGNYGKTQAGNNTDNSYLFNPNYTALILRKTQDDLNDWFHRALKFPLFAANLKNVAEKPFKMQFESGARFDFGHMQDIRSIEDIQGKEYVRIAIEELGQLGSEELFLMILGSCRTVHDGMVSQLFATANPGGPGNKWIKSRYLRDLNGAKVEPGVVQLDPNDRSRVYFHSTIFDNPYFLAKNRDYVAYLESLPAGSLREQWLHGNFDAEDGLAFEHFRGEKRQNEPENAIHVLKCTKEQPEPVELLPYWPRAIGVDWGYSHNSVAGWGCWTPKGQLHLYRELSVSRKGTVELGAEIAMKSIPDLEQLPNQHMVVYLSPDAFARTDDTHTEAEQIARGIGTVLGRDSAFVLAPTQDESSMAQDEAWSSMMRRQKEFSGKTHLTIVRANNARKPGWNLIREYLRWWPLVNQTGTANDELAREILLKQGVMAYKQYMDQFEQRKAETLPKLQIWSCCPTAIKGLEEATEKESDREDVEKTNSDGDDAIDMTRYLCMGFSFSEADKPRNIYIADKVNELKARSPGMDTNSLVMANRIAEAAYDKQHGAALKGFNIPRMAGPNSRRHRVN